MADLRPVNTATFEQDVLQSPQPVLVKFTATWCGPCKAVLPAIKDMAAAYEGSVEVVKLDIDENPELTQRYGVRGVPTLLLFRRGEPMKFEGTPTRSALAAFLDNALEDAQ